MGDEANVHRAGARPSTGGLTVSLASGKRPLHDGVWHMPGFLQHRGLSMRSWPILGFLSILSCDAFTGDNPLYCSSEKKCADAALQCNLTTHVCESPEVLAKDPDITSITPFAVSRAGGFTVKVSGKNFDTLQTMTIGNVNAEFMVSTPTELSLTIPPMPGFCGPVSILMTSTEGRMVQKTDKLRYRADKLEFELNLSLGPFDPDIHTLQNVRLPGRSIDDFIALNHSMPPDFSYLQGTGANNFMGMRWRAARPTALEQLIPTRLTSDGPLVLVGSNGADTLQLWRLAGTMPEKIMTFEEVVIGDPVSHQKIAVGNFDGAASEKSIALLATAMNQIIIRTVKVNEKGEISAQKNQIIEEPTTEYNQMSVGDFNNDGFDDFVLTSKNAGNAIILLNDKATGWVQAHLAQIKTTGTRSVVADMNGDGFDDIVTYGASGSVGLAATILYNQSGTGFSSYTVPTDIASVQNLALTDFDCDGLPDMAVNSVNELYVHINLGASFSGGTKLDVGPRTVRAMTAGAYDAVRRATIVLALPSAGGIDSVLVVGRN